MEQQIFSLINDFSYDKATPLQWIDLAFYFTVLHLFDFKLQLARYDCFRLDFKLHLINQFLIWINCPELLQISQPEPQTNSYVFSVIYLILYCGVFEHCDESIDTQLHGLIKSVPTMLLKQNLPATIETTII